MMIDEKAAEEWVLADGNSASDRSRVRAHLAGQRHERERIWAALETWDGMLRAELSKIIFEGQER